MGDICIKTHKRCTMNCDNACQLDISPDTALLPKPEEWPFDLADLRIDTYHVKPSGGFSINSGDYAVRIRHLPSGLEASSSEDRSQHRNKAKAMELLAVMVKKWKVNGRLDGVEDSDDPSPDKTDAELGFAYRMMVRAHYAGLVVNFVSGDISLPKNKR